MFMSEYSHSLDTKGRLIIPMKFREELGEHFYVTRGLDHCLFIYTDAEWETFMHTLTSVPQLSNTNARKMNHFFISGAAECEVDKQGRILIPAHLRKFASLDKDVVLAGVGNRIEIWDKDAWEAYNDYDDVEELANTLADFNI